MSQIWFNSTSNGTNVRVVGFGQRIIIAVLRFFWRCMPGVTRRLLTKRFMATSPYVLNKEESACLSRGRPFQIEVHGKPIHAWQWGAGPGVLMVHGWNGSGAQFHRFVDPLVRAGFTAIAIDGPGHGQSGGRSTSYFEFTDVVRAFLSPRHGLNIQAMIGHSFGAAAIINGLEKERLGLPIVSIAPIIRLRELLLQVFERFGVPEDIHTAIIGDFEARFGYNMVNDNPVRLIGRLPGNLLIIHDDGDRSASYPDAKEQARTHDHVDLHTTTGLGHRRILSDGEVIEAALTFIDAKADDSRKNDKRSDIMSLHQAIIDQYTTADEDQRLGLYLIHRGLRQDFNRIDLADAANVRIAARQAVPDNGVAVFRKCCLGRLRS